MSNWKTPYLKFVIAAAVNATIYVSYRLYVHKLNTKINKLTSENEELLKKLKLDLHPILIKNFLKHEKVLQTFNFVETEDDLAKLKIALFDYKGYIFALRKYDIHNRPEYTLLTETSKMHKDGIMSSELCNEFLKKMKLDKVPVVWKNQSYEQFEKQKNVTKPKVKRRISVKIEKEVSIPEEK